MTAGPGSKSFDANSAESGDWFNVLDLIRARGTDPVVKVATHNRRTGSCSVPTRSVAVFVAR